MGVAPASTSQIGFGQNPAAGVQQATSTGAFLDDVMPFLSTNEKNFVHQLAGMGFNLPCVARTVKRLGQDDKEVSLY